MKGAFAILLILLLAAFSAGQHFKHAKVTKATTERISELKAQLEEATDRSAELRDELAGTIETQRSNAKAAEFTANELESKDHRVKVATVEARYKLEQAKIDQKRDILLKKSIQAESNLSEALRNSPTFAEQRAAGDSNIGVRTSQADRNRALGAQSAKVKAATEYMNACELELIELRNSEFTLEQQYQDALSRLR